MIRDELGVYLLGAISPADRARVGRHLASCFRCREELAGLASLPGLLGTIPPYEAGTTWADDAAELLPHLTAEALIRRAARTRRRRRLAAALAGGFLAAAGAVTGLQMSQSPAATPAGVAAPRWTAPVSGSSAATGAWAAVRYAAQPWGTELELQVTGIPRGTRIQLIVSDSRGQDAAAGGWTIADGSPPGWYPGSVPLRSASLRGFDVTANGKTLVSFPAR